MKKQTQEAQRRKAAKTDTEQPAWAQRFALARPWASRGAASAKQLPIQNNYQIALHLQVNVQVEVQVEGGELQSFATEAGLGTRRKFGMSAFGLGAHRFHCGTKVRR